MRIELIIALIISAIISYLLGGINAAIIISKLKYHEDIRTKGSGNPGFTNFKRVYGNSFISWSVMILDILKAVVPVCVTAIIFFYNSELLGIENDAFALGAQFSGLFCMLGHCFPIWYKFKGGKAFMTGFGTIWFVDWRMALIAMTVFLILLFTIKFMSLCSCISALSCPIILSIFMACEIHALNYYVLALAICGSVLIIARHWRNFVRLARHEESKFSLHSKKKETATE